MKKRFIYQVVLFGLLSGLWVGSLRAQTVSYWRMDADARGQLDCANAMRDEFPLIPMGRDVVFSYRRPVRQLPAFSILPERARQFKENTGSFFFSGKGAGYLSVPAFARHLDFTRPFTLEGWFRSARPASRPRTILSVGGGTHAWAIRLLQTEKEARLDLQWVCSGETNRVEIGSIGANAAFGWHSLALTCAPESDRPLAFVLDGRSAQVDRPLPRTLRISPDSPLYFGAMPDGSDLFCGELDLWRVSDRPLPPVAMLYQSRVKTVSFWSLIPEGGSLGLDDLSAGKAYSLTLGKDGGVTPVPDAALGMIPHPDPLTTGHALPNRTACLQMRGGIGRRSLLRA